MKEQKPIEHNGTIITRRTVDGITGWYDEEDNKYVGATTIVKSWFEKFDTMKVATACSNNPKKKEYFSRYPGVIMRDWDEAGEIGAEKGNIIHELMEDLLVGKKAEISMDDPYNEEKRVCVNLAKAFLKEYTLLDVEYVIFTKDYQVVAVIDCLAVNNKTGNIAVCDWKTGKDIDKVGRYDFINKAWHGGLGELEYIKDTNYNKYSLQLNIEEYILNREGYFPPGTMYEKLIFHINQDRFEKHLMRNKAKAIEKIFEQRKFDIGYKKITEGDRF